MSGPAAVIVGAGIGGLAAATTLRRRGWGVRVYERSGGPGDLGFALALAANAMHALDELGVAGQIRAAGFAPRRGELCRPDGRALKRIEAQSAGPLVFALRRDLHATLLQHSGAEVRSGEVTHVADAGDRATVTLSDGTTDSADVVVGADGVGSMVRRQLHPDEPPPRNSGYASIRGVTSAANDVLRDIDGVGYFGDGVEAAMIRATRDVIYWYVSLTADLVSSRDPRAILTPLLREFDPRFRAVVDATPANQTRFDELLMRAPLPSWGRGRITLLGDAAHPVLPHTGQGAAQSLEDAVALGLALSKGGDIVGSLRRYEDVRSKRTRKLIALGPRIARVTTTRSRMMQLVRTLAIQLTPTALLGDAPGGGRDPHGALR